jgi:hypothetical protein
MQCSYEDKENDTDESGIMVAYEGTASVDETSLLACDDKESDTGYSDDTLPYGGTAADDEKSVSDESEATLPYTVPTLDRALPSSWGDNTGVAFVGGGSCFWEGCPFDKVEMFSKYCEFHVLRSVLIDGMDQARMQCPRLARSDTEIAPNDHRASDTDDSESTLPTLVDAASDEENSSSDDTQATMPYAAPMLVQLPYATKKELYEVYKKEMAASDEENSSSDDTQATMPYTAPMLEPADAASDEENSSSDDTQATLPYTAPMLEPTVL